MSGRWRSRLATEQWPEEGRFWCLKGKSHLETGEYEEAWRCFEESMRREDLARRAEGLIGKAVVRAKQKRYDEAVELLGEPVAGASDDVRRLHYRAEFAVLAGDIDLAKRMLGELEELRPGFLEDVDGGMVLAAYVSHAAGEFETRDRLLELLRPYAPFEPLYFTTMRLKRGERVERCEVYVIQVEGKGHKSQNKEVPYDFEWRAEFEVYVLDKEQILDEVRRVIPVEFDYDLKVSLLREDIWDEPTELGVASKKTGFLFRRSP